MKAHALLGCMTCFLAALSACHAANHSEFGTDALKAAGVDLAANPAFESPKDRSSVTLGSHQLTLQTYHTKAARPRLGGETPHCAFAAVPSIWGFGPVTIWEQHRLLFACGGDYWWSVVDAGGDHGIELCLLIETHNARNDVEFQFYQERQGNGTKPKLLTLFPVPMGLLNEGFGLHHRGEPGTPNFVLGNLEPAKR